MNNTDKSLIRWSATIALAAGFAIGWFAHTWQGLPVSVSDSSAILASPRPDIPPPTVFAQPLEERIQLTEAQLKKAQANYAEVLRERDQLAKTNSALDDARLKAEKAQARAEQGAALMAGITSKLSDGQLQVPQTVAEAAVYAGLSQRTAADFHTKWGDKAPAEGTPESAAYHQDMDAVTTSLATAMKSLGADGMEDTYKKPASLAQFQSLQLYGSLQLNDTQWQQLDGTLNRYYAEGFNRKLEGASRPEAGEDAWEQQRDALSQRAFNEVQALLTPQQRADFSRLYKSTFLWELNIGGR